LDGSGSAGWDAGEDSYVTAPPMAGCSLRQLVHRPRRGRAAGTRLSLPRSRPLSSPAAPQMAYDIVRRVGGGRGAIQGFVRFGPLCVLDAPLATYRHVSTLTSGQG